MSTLDSRVLLLRLGGLGDLLAALPSISYLRKIWPGRYFSLVCREEYGLLFKKAAVADEIIPVGGRLARPLFSGFCGEDSKTMCGFENISLAVGWMQKPPSPEMGDALRSLGCPIFQAIVPAGVLAVPISRFFFDETRKRFPDRGPDSPEFEECARLILEEEPGIDRLPGSRRLSQERYAVVHPGSGGESKRWPLAGFLEIVRRLACEGVPGFIVTGDAEESFAERLRSEIFPHGWVWIRRPPLIELARLLAGAAFMIGNDSGVTHLAAASGTRVLALFREDLTPSWTPFGLSRILAARALSEINPERVWAALRGEGGFLS